MNGVTVTEEMRDEASKTATNLVKQMMGFVAHGDTIEEATKKAKLTYGKDVMRKWTQWQRDEDRLMKSGTAPKEGQFIAMPDFEMDAIISLFEVMSVELLRGMLKTNPEEVVRGVAELLKGRDSNAAR